MSAISAIVNWNHRPVDRTVLDRANACVRHRCPDGSWVWTEGAVGMAQADLAVLPEDEPGVQVQCGPLRIAASCRIDNREELRATLPVDCRPVNSTDTAFILSAYQAWGDKCSERLIGDFAFIIWNETDKSVYAARDISGVRTLFYYSDAARLFLASDRTQIVQDSSLPVEIDDEQVIEYLTPTYQMSTGWDQGLFKAFHSVPAGSYLRAKDGKIDVRSYWQWMEQSPERINRQEVTERYLVQLKEAISCRSRSRAAIGIELSGGLDSSALACLSAQMWDNSMSEIHTLSDVFDVATEVDERPGIEAVLAMYPHLHRAYQVADEMYGPQCLKDDWEPRSIMGPCEILMPSANFGLYQMAVERGCRIVVTGESGDVLNDGDDRVYYDLIRRRRIAETARRLRLDWARYRRYTARMFITDGVLPLLTPLPILRRILEARTRRMGPGEGWELPEYIPSSLAAKVRAMDESLRIERARRTQVKCPTARETLEDLQPPSIALSIQYPQPIQTVHPYMDRRLIEFVLSMPQDMKWEHEESDLLLASRHHHRLAMKGIIPESVRVRNVGVEFSPSLQHNFTPELVRKWLLSHSMVHIFERGYAEPAAFLDAVAECDNPGGYLASMISVEGWLRAMEPGGKMARLAYSQVHRTAA
ncbi:MAG: hypothetical protein HOH43_01500 [Candidatus Latescibacteria bacterium]|jgi:asparagine synthetase B (glutamine-hydrolysing)|nr:hypothetical protein [Candidatus Latescibacterota bacterium]